MNRRNFISGIGAGSLLAAFGETIFTLPAFAKGSGTKNFVLIKVTKGWDVTLGLDPRTHTADGSTQEDVFLEYSENEIIDANGLRLGPAAAALKPYSSELAIINGIAMAPSDTGHDSGLAYISTGNGQGHAPDLPIEIATSTDAGLIGVVTNSMISTVGRNVPLTMTQSLENYGTAVNSDGFLNYMKKMNAKKDFINAAIAAASDPSTKNALTKELQKHTQELKDIRANYSDMYEQELRTSGLLLASAFATKAAYHGQVFTSFNLDTHSNHEKAHLSEQTKAWNGIAEIFKTFKQTPNADGTGSVWDQSLFMVVSEFARTPALNASKGKDHNPLTNSVLLGGGLVKPGTLGASAILKRSERVDKVPLHAGLPMDFATGQVATTRKQAAASNFNYIRPENVVNTVAEIIGVDRRRFQSVAEHTPLLTGLVK